ncbi:MAG: DUF188 domain-containing protein [bacterium]|nr:DUF188 domain-containing protein [bacterium]
MRVLIDGDASPIKEIAIKVCQKYEICCIIYMDYAHEYDSDYAKIIYCDKGKDSVDLKIGNDCNKDDIIVTQDYGLATLVLSKGATVLHNNGFVIDNSNIDTLLEARYIGSKLRNKVKIKGPRKRTNDDDLRFEKKLNELLGG